MSSKPEGRPADYATRSIFDDSERGTFDAAGGLESTAEICDTINELVESFGAAAVMQCLDAHPDLAARGSDSERVLEALRCYTLLLLDSPYPKVTAHLIGKLAHLELSTGSRIDLGKLGKGIGVSKQALSRRLAIYAARLGLPRPDSTPASRASHRLMNRRNYGLARNT